MKMVRTVISYTLQLSTPFILALVVLICLFVGWINLIFCRSGRRTSNKPFGYEFSNETQVALAVFVVSLTLAVAIATYGNCDRYIGISTSRNISKSINGVWCHLFDMNHGYIIGQEKERGRMVDYALELNRFTEALTQRYGKIQMTFEELKTQKIIDKDCRLTINSTLSGNSSLVLAASEIASTYSRIHE